MAVALPSLRYIQEALWRLASRVPSTAVMSAVFAVGSASAASGAEAATAPSELAYLAVADGYWEVWLSKADGTEARQLTRTRHDKTRLSWYPDGKALLAGCNDGTVVRIDLSGTETPIHLEQFPVVDVALSPDGKYLTYSFSTAIDGNDLWMSRADGSNAERVVKMMKLQHEPIWSSDGRYVYFLSGEGGQAHDIWRMSMQDRSTEQLTVGSLYHFDIAVSARGDIAYSGNSSGNYEIYLQRPGVKPEQLTNDPALDARPAFSPDAKYIVFESTRGGVPNLWRIDTSSGSLTQITTTKDGARAPAWYSGARP